MLYDIATFPRAAFFEQAAFFSENVGKRLFQIPNVIFVCRRSCRMHRAATYEALFCRSCVVCSDFGTAIGIPLVQQFFFKSIKQPSTLECKTQN